LRFSHQYASTEESIFEGASPMPRASAASNVEKPWNTRKRNAARRRRGSATAFSIVTCWSFFSALRRASSCLSRSPYRATFGRNLLLSPRAGFCRDAGLLAAVVNDRRLAALTVSRIAPFIFSLCTRRVAHHNGNLAGGGAGWGFHGPSLPYDKRVPRVFVFLYISDY
jgi:hypothetical protein